MTKNEKKSKTVKHENRVSRKADLRVRRTVHFVEPSSPEQDEKASG
jgi:hypothetical protein